MTRETGVLYWKSWTDTCIDKKKPIANMDILYFKSKIKVNI